MKSFSIYQTDARIDGLMAELADLPDNSPDILKYVAEIEALYENRVELLENLALQALNADAMIEAIKTVIDSYREKISSWERIKDRSRAMLFDAIPVGERLKTAKVNISWRKSESVQITDPSAIPSEFQRVKTIKEPDKNAIKAQIRGGKDVPGAFIVEKTNLVIS